MDVFVIAGALIFGFGYLSIALEHKLNTNKAPVALAMGALLWILVAFSGREVSHALAEAGSEIFAIVIFLLSAMTLVEILVHYNFFDIIRQSLLRMKLGDRAQFAILVLITFFASSILDNLTATIVMIQISKNFFRGRNLLIMVAGIVLMANAGGAWSPIGDVTTIMLWLAGKFSAADVMIEGILPALAFMGVSTLLLARQIKTDTKDVREDAKLLFTRGEKIVIGTALASFSLPVIMNVFGLPPYLGLLLGLAFVWILIELLRSRSEHVTHLEANIERLLQKTDLASIKFFTGILLAVSALHALGILHELSILLLGAEQTVDRAIIGNIALGFLSSVLDNVPLTAMAINIIALPDPSIWVLLALSVGIGGSFLVIGSAAGVVAMGMVKELTFAQYMKIATIPAVVAFLICIGVWYAQYTFFFAG